MSALLWFLAGMAAAYLLSVGVFLGFYFWSVGNGDDD